MTFQNVQAETIQGFLFFLFFFLSSPPHENQKLQLPIFANAESRWKAMLIKNVSVIQIKHLKLPLPKTELLNEKVAAVLFSQCSSSSISETSVKTD